MNKTLSVVGAALIALSSAAFAQDAPAAARSDAAPHEHAGAGSHGATSRGDLHEAGHSIHNGLRATGHAIHKGLRATGHAIHEGVRATGHAIHQGAEKVAGNG